MMEKVCNGQESESAVVFEVIGEPAIVINGVPNLPPGGTTSIRLDNKCDAEPKYDPCFGEWLVGRMVRKMFGDQYYSGKVVKYDSRTKWYGVVYDDGDFEDLEWHELEEVLLPLDISVPLKALALQRCKSESRLSVVKARRNYTKCVGETEKTLDLLRIPRASESKSEKLIEENYNSGWIWKQKGSQVESLKTALQMCRFEESVTETGENTAGPKNYQNGDDMAKMLEMVQRPKTTGIKDGGAVQENVSSEVTVQETLKRQREIQKQSWKTARAEKQKRQEKSLVQGSAHSQS